MLGKIQRETKTGSYGTQKTLKVLPGPAEDEGDSSTHTESLATYSES